MTMLLNGLEAYEIRHLVRLRKRRGVETFGTLWGYESRAADGRHRLFNVGFVSIDTSARRTTHSIDNDVAALTLKRDLVAGFWPHYEFLGDFHTHPFGTVPPREILARRSFDFSKGDRDSIEYFITQCHLPYRVGLVLTIVALKRPGRGRPRVVDPATIEFPLGRYRCWLRACVARRTRPGAVNVTFDPCHLDCPGILGLRDVGRLGLAP